MRCDRRNRPQRRSSGRLFGSLYPGFPVWAALQAPTRGHDPFRALAAQALAIDGPEIAQLCDAARRHGVFVSLGFTEGTEASVGCIWNSNLLIGDDGSVLNHHRKLVPTFYEKLVWANGDARGLRVSPTRLGRLGMLICGENTNPLSRYALMAQGEQVHISSYPPIWPTRPPSEDGAYDLKRAIEIRAGAHAFEAKVFNIVASGFVDAAMREALGTANRASLDIIDGSPRGISLVIEPSCNSSAKFFPNMKAFYMPISTRQSASNRSNSTTSSAIITVSISST